LAFFVDQVITNLVRLRTGQDHAGWVLRSVRGREAIFDQQTYTLALLQPLWGRPCVETWHGRPLFRGGLR